MNDSTNQDLACGRLRRGIVLRVREDVCEILHNGQPRSVRYATRFPSPHSKRVSPGHLVAVATTPDGTEAIVWRWYDAVVLGEEEDLIRLWEPAHGDVLAQARRSYQPSRPGTRAYLSAGLPGADWWVAGPAARPPQGIFSKTHGHSPLRQRRYGGPQGPSIGPHNQTLGRNNAHDPARHRNFRI